MRWPLSVGSPAIILDRDGVLNVNRHDYVKTWDEFVFLPGTFDALRQLSQLGYPLIVVTNQAGVSRQIIPKEEIDRIHRRMLDELRRHSARVDAVYYCPHQAGERCGCRKPEPGLILLAAQHFDIDLSLSVMVGDAHTDILAGRRAGCRTILVRTGRGEESLRKLSDPISLGGPMPVRPDVVADSLADAVPAITELVGRKRTTRPMSRSAITDVPQWVSGTLLPSLEA
jgi:histidinol-phosphate phosphatase family protein